MTCNYDHCVEDCDCGGVHAILEEDDYLSLADEMNDPDVGPWVEEDWDPQAVANGRKYAEEHGLSWPPRAGDFDRWYERQHVHSS